MSRLGEFLQMGGYALWVWASYGFALAAMLALLVQSLIAAGRRKGELETLRRRVRQGDVEALPGDADTGMPRG